jgi:branched-chain amino acid transport system ATP-binding protein
MTALLEVRDLHGGYGSVDVLRGVSLEVAPGSVVALMGANGAGKTTTMRLLSGLLRPSRGTILLDGVPIHGLDGSAVARLGLAHAPEGRRVFGPLSTEDNLLLGAYTWLPHVLGYRKAAAADLEAAYDRFPRLKDRRHQQAGTLSGGEQQMLAIARALMARPKLLLLDEPSMGLAPVVIQEVYRAILRLKAEGTTLLLVEQFARTALRVADYAYVMDRGAIAVAGTPAELGRDMRVVEAYLG